ncbi:MAG TPA: GNAT family protein [Longimicrobiaceae bacterium]|jgi:RimJ/RimL family protein N-acetyltransferase
MREAMLVIETARLRLRRFAEADLPAFVAYRNDPEVARWQSWDGCTAEEGRAFLDAQAGLRPGTPGAWSQLAVELKATGELLGDCALHVGGDDPRLGEIGYTLARAAQGRGYGTEAVRALLGYAFGTLGLHRVSATTDCENAASVALLERVGMRREAHFRRHVWFKGRWSDEYVYALLRDEWQALHPPPSA